MPQKLLQRQAQRHANIPGAQAWIRITRIRPDCLALFTESSVYRAKSSSQEQIRPVPPRLFDRRLTPPLRHFGVIPAD